MNYDKVGLFPFLEIKFPTTNIVKRINKSVIKSITERHAENGKPRVYIWVGGDTWMFDGSMEEFDKASKTVFI